MPQMIFRSSSHDPNATDVLRWKVDLAWLSLLYYALMPKSNMPAGIKHKLCCQDFGRNFFRIYSQCLLSMGE